MSEKDPLEPAAIPATGDPADEYDVVLHGVSHSYGRNQVLDDVSLAVCRGSFFGILGPSGSGKTTLLRIIGGFIIPGTGQVYIGNELMGSTPPYRRHTAMVFQHLALFPHMTVMENLSYGLKLHGVLRDEIAAKVGRALEMVHLSGLEARRPRQLSGGEQQRVALARALVLEPRVVLFDEPLGSLDLKLRREMQVELKSIQRRLGTTFLYVTHDQQEAIAMCDRIAVMNKGRIVQAGTAEDIYERPETRFVADFIGDINFLDGQVTGHEDSLAVIDAGGLVLRAPDRGRFAPGTAVTLCIRPERLVLGEAATEAPAHLSARVVELTYAGAVRRCLLELPNGARLKADMDARALAELRLGSEVTVGWSIQDGYLVAR